MTKLQDSQAGSIPHTHESRGYARRKLSGMAYVELAQDNGGILLNLSEGGLAVQSALTLTAREFPELRFQLPNMRGWLTASGRVAWMSESKKEAGIQFLDLHEHARAQIRTWVAGEAEFPEASNGEIEPPDQQTPRAKNAGYEKQSWASGPQTTANTAPRQPEAKASRLEKEPRHAAPSRVQEDATFKFHDYSMFAADVNAVDPWVDAGAKRKGWGTYALFTILLAALFFVLGAMIGRDNLEQFVASVEALKQNQTEAPPRAKPPTAENAIENTPAAAANDGAPSQESSPASPTSKDSSQADLTSKDGTNAQETANAAVEPKNSEPSQPAAAESSKGQNESANNKSDGPQERSASGRATSVPREPASAAKGPVNSARASRYAAEDAEVTAQYGRSILVHAPALGSPPFFVHLPNEAVSASPWVAISARRSIQVPPRADTGAYGSERVIIGKLLAHSDPFYPQEARSRKIEGSVQLRALVGRSGQVIKVTEVSGPPLLVAAAAVALREWRYEPTFINGDPVETETEVTMVFRSP